MAIPRNLGNLAQGANTAGVLQPSYGGTGLTATGPAGNILTSNGTVWVSSVGGAQAFVTMFTGGNTAPTQDSDGFGLI